MRSVLILDGYWNKSVAAVRALGSRGWRVGVGECTRFATAFLSRHCSHRFVYPSPISQPDAFIAALESELATGGYDVVLPMEFSTQFLLGKHRERLSCLAKIPLPEPELMARLDDKAEATLFASQLGVHCPRTVFPRTTKEASEMSGELPYPVLIKPRRSSGGRGIRRADDADSFRSAWGEVHARYPFPIVQEMIPPGGESYGVGVLMNFSAEVRASFAWRRLREYPVSGGPSTLRESVSGEQIREIAEMLLSSVGWIGPAMVEFRVDPRDGIAKFLEINPRFWGSLNHSILSGVDFPYLLCSMAIDGDIEPQKSYRVGVRSRTVLHGDLMHFLTNPNRFRMSPGLLDFSVADDLLSATDPGPVFGRVLSLLALTGNREFRTALGG